MPAMNPVEGSTITLEAEGAAEAEEGVGFEEFFQHEHGDLFGSLWLVTRNRSEAEEIMQEAFLRVWQRWTRVREMDDPAGYLYRTAMNVFRSRYRRTRLALRRMAGAGPPVDPLLAVEERDEVVRLLAELSPRQRAALVLTDLMGFTSEEAAGALGIRASTVRVLTSRARGALRKSGTADQERGEGDG